MPGQWSYSIGPCSGIEFADQLWMSRFILHRLSEHFQLIASLDPKPVRMLLYVAVLNLGSLPSLGGAACELRAVAIGFYGAPCLRPSAQACRQGLNVSERSGESKPNLSCEAWLSVCHLLQSL